MKYCLGLLVLLLMSGCNNKTTYNHYNRLYGCERLGNTFDMNGANAGGISTVFKCGDKYLVLYGGGHFYKK